MRPANKPDVEEIGDWVYRFANSIGSGAFATVYHGYNKWNQNQIVAIKRMEKKKLNPNLDRKDKDTLFQKEIKILKELSRLKHPNLVKLIDTQDSPLAFYMIMEYCNGGDLHEYMSTHGAMDEDSICHLMKQVAVALHVLHAEKIVHRDLKPQNLLLKHSGVAKPSVYDMTVKLADFGFARVLPEMEKATTTCGSPMYMAPEVIMCVQYTAKADCFSIGVIMYQCLTTRAPFNTCNSPSTLRDYYRDHSNLLPDIPPGCSRELKDIIYKLIQKRQELRLSSAEILEHPFFNPPSLLAHISTSPLSVHVPSPSPPSPPLPTHQEETNEDGFVLVPNDLPHDGPGRLFSGTDNQSSNVNPAVASGSNKATSPTRQSSEPIPVPSQRKNFEILQRSAGRSPSPNVVTQRLTNSKGSNSSLASSPRGYQMTPPQRHRKFSLGTPPACVAIAEVEPRSAPVYNVPARNSTIPSYLNTASAGYPMVPIAEQSQGSMHHAQTEPRHLVRLSNTKGFDTGLPAPPPQSLMAQLTSVSPPHSYFYNRGSMTNLVRTTSNTSLSRHRRLSSGTDSPVMTDMFANNNVLFDFIIPELREETLMDDTHKDLVHKFTFVLALVESILDLAKVASSALGKPINLTLARKYIVSKDTHTEELLLYLRALSLLDITLQTAKDEIRAGSLQSTSTVKNIMSELKETYRVCLTRCQQLQQLGVMNSIIATESEMAAEADQIIYEYAIELCKHAALLEFNNRTKTANDSKDTMCFHEYRSALILLHSLAEKSDHAYDKDLLMSFCQSIGKRIEDLLNRGSIDPQVAFGLRPLLM